ncbi:PREDICTED: paralemmin-3 isoform X1 [Odobenus rosmarus divergens]|uniref:Paralemmin-3 isoform X1 n=1 Tax=Odobenus rosmarus divergens TaxID=9708 RepID=A0A2U3VUI4_ODORO|nr:PREDICTED: paralemmin-3 isoform X1 [Odobenus rosmarus divergens]
MALQSQMWSPATAMPMAESSLYRQRLEVIAEKRRLQEEIRAARRELEDEKLRVERLKRKSLRERWLMDGTAEGTERQGESASKDPQSPEGQAQARIQNLEDSLFTLQSQLQLLQGASTGAQHKPSGRPTWRRQGHRPLSQPTVEAGPTDHADLNKRASLPARPVDTSPESPSEPRDEAVRAPPALRLFPGAAGASSEANGPCPGPSPPPEKEPCQGLAASKGGVDEAKGGVVKVVWEGLRATEDCATGATGPELEAKVEEMVLEAVGDRQEASCPELPSWVTEDRGIVEVVWEGVGGPDSSDSEATGEAGGRGRKAAQTGSPRLQVRLVGAAPGEGGVPRGSPDADGPGGSGGEEGSFIWVERVTLSEEWEELVVEGLEGPRVWGKGGGPESPLGVERGAGEEAWEAGSSQAEEPVGGVKKGSEEKAGTEQEGADMSLMVERKGSEDSLEPERTGGEEKLGTEREAVEGPLRAETERGEEPLQVEQKGGEEELEAEKEDEEPLGVQQKGDEEKVKATEEPLVMERKEGKESPKVERTGGEEPLEAEEGGGEAPLEAEKTEAVEEDLSPEEQRESGRGQECQAEEVSEAGAPLGAKEESRPEEEEPQPQEKQEGSLEEGSVRPQTPAEGQGPSGDATPLLAETPTPEQPAECQPLLRVQGPRAHPSARPVPTYAPARQPKPSAPAEGEEASGPKQKTCQCCAVM